MDGTRPGSARGPATRNIFHGGDRRGDALGRFDALGSLGLRSDGSRHVHIWGALDTVRGIESMSSKLSERSTMELDELRPLILLVFKKIEGSLLYDERKGYKLYLMSRWFCSFFGILGWTDLAFFVFSLNILFVNTFCFLLVIFFPFLQ